MSRPARTPWRYLGDRDVLHAAAVTLLAVLLSGGLVWLGYLLHVVWIAWRTPSALCERQVLLVFGRRLAVDRPERDYRARLARARALIRSGQVRQVLLLGGCSGGRVSEAEAGYAWLARRGLPAAVEVVLEQDSVDSLENLRHARDLLRGASTGALPPVALLTSRYHLARCLLLARRLGFEGRPVAAERALPCTPRYLVRLLREAAYLMWIDLGVRWARLVGLGRMAERIS
ncbi:ElyC/SanA/YdcF family protein [Fulvimonas yonginensis]|uniref:ElyC/SanA/YdcF family protein n=1 Tax=Fulvimonas yonginensis TaxID=1495200 RepID=A0ABU8J7F5_9GAMM